jgi:hypothetical protein
MDYTQVQWRVGTHVRRTIVAIVPSRNPDHYPILGMMDTDELAAEVVKAHNQTLETMTFTEKEQLISDLEKTREIMQEDTKLELEDAILIATDHNVIRSKRVYDAYGASAEMLQDMAISLVVPHAIKCVRTQ